MGQLQRKLTRLHKQSENAVSSFVQIEQQLNASNDALADVIDGLEQEMSRITAQWHQATQRKRQNTETLERISALIRGNEQ